MIVSVPAVGVCFGLAAASLTRFRVPMEAWRRRQRFRDNEKRNSLFTDVIFESFEGTKMSFSFEAD